MSPWRALCGMVRDDVPLLTLGHQRSRSFTATLSVVMCSFSAVMLSRSGVIKNFTVSSLLWLAAELGCGRTIAKAARSLWPLD